MIYKGESKMASKRTKSNLMTALMYMIIGAMFCVFKSAVVDYILFVASVLFIVVGVLDLLRKNIVSGILNIAIGVVIYLVGKSFISLILVVLGAFILVRGIFDLIAALRYKKKNIISILFAALTIFVGFVLMASQWLIVNWLFVAIGVLLIVDGLIAVFETLTRKRR